MMGDQRWVLQQCHVRRGVSMYKANAIQSERNRDIQNNHLHSRSCLSLLSLSLVTLGPTGNVDDPRFPCWCLQNCLFGRFKRGKTRRWFSEISRQQPSLLPPCHTLNSQRPAGDTCAVHSTPNGSCHDQNNLGRRGDRSMDSFQGSNDLLWVHLPIHAIRAGD